MGDLTSIGHEASEDRAIFTHTRDVPLKSSITHGKLCVMSLFGVEFVQVGLEEG